jgi:MFS family permease
VLLAMCLSLVLVVASVSALNLALSTITSAFPPELKARGVAIWSGFAAAGAILGMLAAGGLLEQWSWKSIFVTSAATVSSPRSPRLFSPRRRAVPRPSRWTSSAPRPR